MGGLAIIAAIAIMSVLLLLRSGASDSRIVAVLIFGAGMALVGFIDDYVKLRRRGAYGFPARYRVVLELLLSAGLAAYLLSSPAHRVIAGLTLPFPLAWMWAWPVFAVLVLFGTTNAVNLTDGLDGLAAGLVATCGVCLGLACGTLGEPELEFLSFAVAGAAAGFLWFNANPARIFMGDVGSTALGGLLGAIAVAARLEIFLALVGFIFVVEALSVIGQVVSFRTTGRRILKMAPLHHHLELSGWPEQTIVVRFWVLGACLAGLGVLVLNTLQAWPGG